jgi:hypothetical protein
VTREEPRQARAPSHGVDLEERAMRPAASPSPLPALHTRLLALIGTGSMLVSLVPLTFGYYGRFTDEFYYVACSKHWALGYVDHPPLSVWVLWLMRSTLGDSLLAMRLVPAISGLAQAFLTGLLAQRLGAGRFGQLSAASASVTILPLSLFFSFYSMNSLEPLFWSLAALVLVELLRRREPRLWLAYGIVAGLSMLNKHPSGVFMALFAVAFAIAHPALAWRRKELYAGGLIALGLVSPNLIWQVRHEWVSLDFYRASLQKNLFGSPLAAVGQQITAMNPGSLVLLAGLGPLLRSSRRREFAWLLAPTALLLAAFVMTGQSRPDRVLGLYPLLFVAAGIGWERASEKKLWRRLRPIAPALTLLAFIGIAPGVLPLLPPEMAAAHAERLGIVPKIEKVGNSSPLPQWLADRLGWQTLAERVSTVSVSLDKHETPAVVVGSNYGFAGAIEFYGSRYPLPPTYGIHNNYHAWGPPPPSTKTFILVGVPEQKARQHFAEVHAVESRVCALCVGNRREPDLLLARQPRAPIATVWPRLRLLM